MGASSPSTSRVCSSGGFTTKGYGDGSGTGLTVVRDIVENRFGGMIEVRSTVGEGSVFTVTLPMPPRRTSGGARE